MTMIREKSSAGIQCVPIEAKLLSARQVFLEGEIDHQSAMEFLRQILFLNEEDGAAPITLMINSPGGEINAGLMIYDILQTNPAPIVTCCTGRAYSMGALLFAAGRHGRYMLPHAELMLHEPLINGRLGGNSTSIKSISDSLLQTRDKIDRILAEHTGKALEEIEEATRYDHYFSAEESLAFGLCDRILTFREMLEAAERRTV